MELENLEKGIKKKIKNEQRYIDTNIDLSEFGYHRMGFSKKEKQRWTLKSYFSQIRKEYLKNQTAEQKEHYREYQKTHHHENIKREREIQKEWSKNNIEKVKANNKKYISSSKGKIATAKRQAKRDKKGFILLFELNNKSIKIEFHHVNPNFPYVIPVPKEIHKSIWGGNPNHYLGVVANFYRWLEEHPEIQITNEIR